MLHCVHYYGDDRKGKEEEGRLISGLPALPLSCLVIVVLGWSCSVVAGDDEIIVIWVYRKKKRKIACRSLSIS